MTIRSQAIRLLLYSFLFSLFTTPAVAVFPPWKCKDCDQQEAAPEPGLPLVKPRARLFPVPVRPAFEPSGPYGPAGMPGMQAPLPCPEGADCGPALMTPGMAGMRVSAASQTFAARNTKAAMRGTNQPVHRMAKDHAPTGKKPASKDWVAVKNPREWGSGVKPASLDRRAANADVLQKPTHAKTATGTHPQQRPAQKQQRPPQPFRAWFFKPARRQPQPVARNIAQPAPLSPIQVQAKPLKAGPSRIDKQRTQPTTFKAAPKKMPAKNIPKTFVPTFRPTPGSDGKVPTAKATPATSRVKRTTRPRRPAAKKVSQPRQAKPESQRPSLPPQWSPKRASGNELIWG